MDFKEYYSKILKERKKKSRISKKFQLVGLEVASLLNDEKHKSLYIKIAKENNANKIFLLAKEIASKNNIKNKGAYFMKILNLIKKRSKIKSKGKNNSIKNENFNHL